MSDVVEQLDARDLNDEPANVEIRSRETAFTGHVWDVVTETFGYGSQELTRDFVAHPGAVGIVALDRENRVHLIQQYRHPIRERDWEIPAGLLDVVGEEPLDAAKRELEEEADLLASDWVRLGVVHPSPGGSDESITLFLARGLTAAHSGYVREGEESDMRGAWVPLEQAVHAVVGGGMRNMAAMVGVLLTAEHLRRASAESA